MKTDFVRVPEIKSIAIVNTDDVDPFLEKAKLLRTIEQDRKSDLRHIAHLPNIVLLRWLNEERERGHIMQYGSREWWEFVDKKLEDPDWAYLRVDGPKASLGYGD